MLASTCCCMPAFFDAEVMDGLWTHEDLCSIVTYPCLVEESSAASIMFGSNPQSEVIDFCGVKAKVWVPSEAVDDSTMGIACQGIRRLTV